jgi:enoyl-CoA hydratase
MNWRITEEQGVVVVAMNSNEVNRQNDKFFGDLSDALDQLEANYANHPVVLTSDRHLFSAGFDFDYWFPSIAENLVDKVARDYAEFKRVNLRLFTYPRPTVAAINGHAYAGGLITALCCDFRIVANKNANLTLNEVPIGLAMPSLFTELIRYAIGTPVAAKAILTGRIYSPTEGLNAGIVDRAVEPQKLMEEAINLAKELGGDRLTAYAFSKAALQAPILRTIADDAARLDEGFGAAWCSDDARRATARTYADLKSRKTGNSR